MNSDIDPATVHRDNDPQVSRPSFKGNTMGSSCEIGHAVSAEHPSTGAGKHSHHVQTGKCVVPSPRYYVTLILNNVYELLCNDFKGLLPQTCTSTLQYPIKWGVWSVIMYWLELTIDLII